MLKIKLNILTLQSREMSYMACRRISSRLKYLISSTLNLLLWKFLVANHKFNVSVFLCNPKSLLFLKLITNWKPN